MQPEALREARDWLTRAERDLLAAAGALQGAIVLSEMADYGLFGEEAPRRSYQPSY
jgi:hypothetical protein